MVTAFIPFLFPGCGKNVHFFTQAEMFFIVGAALLLDLLRPSSCELINWIVMSFQKHVSLLSSRLLRSTVIQLLPQVQFLSINWYWPWIWCPWSIRKQSSMPENPALVRDSCVNQIWLLWPSTSELCLYSMDKFFFMWSLKSCSDTWSAKASCLACISLVSAWRGHPIWFPGAPLSDEIISWKAWEACGIPRNNSGFGSW